jgi:hypothetical protein
MELLFLRFIDLVNIHLVIFRASDCRTLLLMVLFDLKSTWKTILDSDWGQKYEVCGTIDLT